MTWIDFAIRLIIAFILGVGIGIERQWLKTRSVLKTNVLVTLGAAMFVMLSVMTPGDTSPTRIAAQVVSGIGFLGAGVILREGASVRGINTAATLWCAAAIGSLIGAGFLLQAYFGTLAVVGANLLLRPVVQVFQKKSDERIVHPRHKNGELVAQTSNVPRVENEEDNDEDDERDDNEELIISSRLPIRYRYRLNCHPQDEAKILTVLLESVKNQNLRLSAIHDSKVTNNDSNNVERVEILVEFIAEGDRDRLRILEPIVALLGSRSTVGPLSWEFVSEE
jgi:putative Mg2+ transporter-C (MgtC) family protein